MQQQQQFQTTGLISTLDNKREFKPLRISVTEPSGQKRWFSAFADIGRTLFSAGVGSGPWRISYTERPYTTVNGAQGLNLNIQQAILDGQQAQQPQPQAQVPAPQATSPNAPFWSANMDDRGRAIIRQVAFKEIADKDSKTSETLNETTNIYEQIILGTYEPPPLPGEETTNEAEAASPPVEFIEETF